MSIAFWDKLCVDFEYYAGIQFKNEARLSIGKPSFGANSGVEGRGEGGFINFDLKAQILFASSLVTRDWRFDSFGQWMCKMLA